MTDEELKQKLYARLCEHYPEAEFTEAQWDEWLDLRKGFIDDAMQLIKARDAAKELEGAKTAERIIRSSPDPKADFQKYIRGLEKSNG